MGTTENDSWGTQARYRRLRSLVLYELFMRNDGTFDYQAYNNELQSVQNEGFPNDIIDEMTLIQAYALMLHEKDKAVSRLSESIRKYARGELKFNSNIQQASNSSSNNRSYGYGYGGFPVPNLDRKYSLSNIFAPTNTANSVSDARHYTIIH